MDKHITEAPRTPTTHSGVSMTLLDWYHYVVFANLLKQGRTEPRGVLTVESGRPGGTS